VLSSLDPILVIIAFIIFITGIIRRFQMWRQGRSASELSVRQSKAAPGQFLANLRSGLRPNTRPELRSDGEPNIPSNDPRNDSPKDLSGNHGKNQQANSRAKDWVCWGHLCVICGVILPLIVVTVAQFGPRLPLWIGAGLSLLLDLVGLLAVVGTSILIFKRAHHNKSQTGISLPYPFLALGLLLSILLTGFMAEGLRLSITGQTGLSFLSAPVGWIVLWLMPASPVIHKLVIRLHFLLVLIFIAFIPYSNMRHLWAALISTYFHNRRSEGTLTPIELTGTRFGCGNIADFSWVQLMDTDACMNCGRCTLSCPAHLSGKPLRPQQIIRQIGLQMAQNFITPRHTSDLQADPVTVVSTNPKLMGDEDIWACTTCLACVKACPVFVRHLPDIIGLRRHQVLTHSQFPPEYNQLFKNLETFGDAFGAGSLSREDWAVSINPLNFGSGEEERSQGNQVQTDTDAPVDYLFWVGCTSALYDERTREKTIATARVLNKAGVRFGILGRAETCCGDPARRIGNEYLYEQLATRNIKTMMAHGVRKIVTACPHCFNVLRNEYPQLGGDFDVIHITQLVNELLNDGRLEIKTRSDGRYTYHDPCYLARYNAINRQPRDILGLLLDSDITEMTLSGDNGFCCGAGGGNFWSGKTTGKRIEEMRMDQALATGTDGLVTACPFCEVMFDSAVRQKGAAHTFKVLDIVQLVDQIC